MILQKRPRVYQRRAYRLSRQNGDTQRRPVPFEETREQKLRVRIKELALSHVRWGRRLAYWLLRVEG